MQTTINLIAGICYSKNIKLNYIVEEGEYKIHGNRGRLDQVVMNLASNSKDALLNTLDPKIDVKLSRDENHCHLVVSDNGSGIPKEIQDKVFNHFYTSKGVGEGTGIGLSMVHSIIEEHGGSVNFKSSSEGNVFTVTLPLV